MRTPACTILLIVSGLLSSLAFVGPLGAAQYHVAVTGNDSHDGSAAQPFRTISHGVKNLRPGDTLLIHSGIYRETVDVRVRGTAAAPIRIAAAPHAKVQITGADIVRGWKRCTQDIGAGNPHYKNIYYADIDWHPTTIWNPSILYDNGQACPLVRCPPEGYWTCPATGTAKLTDAKHLTQTRDVWEHTLLNIRLPNGKTTRRIVMHFDPATHTFQLNRDLPPADQFPDGHMEYYLDGRLPGLVSAGSWAWSQTGEHTARIYYWPKSGQVEQARIELPRRSKQLILDHTAHVVVEGLDLGYGMYRKPDDCVISMQASGGDDGTGKGLVIRHCALHDHCRFGVFVRRCTAPKLEYCAVYRNGWGVMLGGNTDALVTCCEIAYNRVDGFRDTYGGHGTTVDRCYIHHHWDSHAHPDNIQTHNDVRGLTVQRTLLMCGGQSVMMGSTDNVTFRQCVIVGAAANMVICGHATTRNAVFEHNTLHLGAMQYIAMAGGSGYHLHHNIMVYAGGSLFYGVPASAMSTFDADNNLYWIPPQVPLRLWPWRANRKAFATLDTLRNAGPWETHSVFKNPGFKNAPICVATLDRKNASRSTLQTLYVRDTSLFQPGDHVEVNFDGVVRTVKNTTKEAVTIQPPIKRLTVHLFLVNWKDKTDFAYDYTTPFGDRYGSTIDVPAFMRGDFDSDGTRDVPPVVPFDQ